MTLSNTIKTIAACALAAGAAPVFSHVALETPSAPAGSTYKAVFQVSHGCQGSATTGVSVRIPEGFQGARPYSKAGWTLSTKVGKLAKAYESHGKQVSEDVTVVSWTAANRDAAVQDAFLDEFMLRGKLPDTAGPLWFKVLQTCENGKADWSDVPAAGAAARDLKFPAPSLEVTALAGKPQGQGAAPAPAVQAVQPVQVSGAWVRATVPGQTGSGAFMNITAKAATRLVRVSTPVAGIAEVHEMKMEGDIMKMRPVAGLDLPAGKTVALSSGGYHVMLMDLKQTLARGSAVPLTLTFKNAAGVESRLDISVPVSLAAPAGGAASKAGAAPPEQNLHKH